MGTEKIKSILEIRGKVLCTLAIMFDITDMAMRFTEVEMVRG